MRKTLLACATLVACSTDSFTGGDAQSDAPITIDGAGPGDDGEVDSGPTQPVYSDIAASARWSSFDATKVNAKAAGAFGATFDGKHVYFAPASSSVALRHDVLKAVDDASAWESFDLTGAGGSSGYAGAAFDGRYVYFVPNTNGNAFGTIIRFDSQSPFASASSWQTFDLTATVDPAAKGFLGAVFDGKFLYLVPNANTATNALFVRYDVSKVFTSVTSWSKVDVSTFNPLANAFAGGAFDGRYVYAAPKDGSYAARYDTQSTFDVASSWSFFAPTTIDPNAKGFFGAIFDGRYVYMPPLNKGTFIARYDTQGAFGTSASWSLFPLASIDTRAQTSLGGAFDGRYVYVDPLLYNGDGGPTFQGVETRFDHTASFATTAAWTKFDMGTLAPPLIAAGASVFDGAHLYVASIEGPQIARFDARTPSQMPQLPAFSGSFF